MIFSLHLDVLEKWHPVNPTDCVNCVFEQVCALLIGVEMVVLRMNVALISIYSPRKGAAVKVQERILPPSSEPGQALKLDSAAIACLRVHHS